MRMTKQELRDEFKQSESDPVIKARIRRLRQEQAKKRMTAAVPGATVVITNPTHYAIALAYRAETMAAPKVVAKSVDFLARRIREIALEHDVPIIENPPLARALHASVEGTTRSRHSTTRRSPRSSDSSCERGRVADRERLVARTHRERETLPMSIPLQPQAAGPRDDGPNQLRLPVGAGLAEDLLQVLANCFVGEAEMLRRLVQSQALSEQDGDPRFGSTETVEANQIARIDLDRTLGIADEQDGRRIAIGSAHRPILDRHHKERDRPAIAVARHGKGIDNGFGFAPRPAQ